MKGFDLGLQYSHIFIYSIRCLFRLTFRSLAAIVSEKSTFCTFSYRKAKITRFDLAVKYIKVMPGSSFKQTMMGWSLRCYIPNFVEIGPPVLENKIFEVFFTIYGHGGHLGYVTSILLKKIHFLVPEIFHTKFG